MSTLKKGVFGLIVVLASMFAGVASAQQCVGGAEALRVFRSINGTVFPEVTVRGGNSATCTRNGYPGGNECPCIVSEGRNNATKEKISIYKTAFSDGSVVFVKKTGNRFEMQTKLGRASGGGTQQAIQDLCANLQGFTRDLCYAAAGNPAVGTAIRSR